LPSSITSPPANTTLGAPASLPKPAPISTLNCDGVQSSTSIPSLLTYFSISSASLLTSSGNTLNSCPPLTCSNCFTDASNVNGAFTLTLNLSPSSPYTPSLNPSSRLITDPCLTITPFGFPVDPDV